MARIFGLNASCAVDEFFAMLGDVSTFVFWCPRGKDTFSYKVDSSNVRKIWLPKISRGKFGNREIVNVIDLLFYSCVSVLALPYLVTFDKIVFKGPPFFNTIIQPVLRLFGVKTYMIIIDDQEKDVKVYGKGNLLKKMYYKWSLWQERYVVKNATKVFVTSEYCYNKLKKLNKNIFHTPNGADVSTILEAKPKKLLGKVLLYGGGFEPWRGLDLLIESFKKLKKKHNGLKLYLIGGGPNFEQVKKLADGDKNIIFTGYVGHDELLSYYKGADVLVMPSRNVLSSTTISSIKCFEYIASGKPTVVTDSGEHATWIRKFDAGLVVKDNVAALTKGLDRVLKDKALYAKLASNAKKHAKDVDYKALKKQFVEEVKL